MLSDIAAAVYISESHLSRTFKLKTGISIITYINNIRLEHARELLLNTSLSIEEIRYRTGFNSRNLFYKNFKNKFGVTPKKYRQDMEE